MITNDLLDAIYKYLISRPMIETRVLVEAIEKQVKEQQEILNKKSKEKTNE